MDRALGKDAKRVLEIRQALSKTSIRKYETMEKALCRDGRIMGLFQFYGANRTGRWAGRLVQVQNLPQNNIKDIGNARKLLKEGKQKAWNCFLTAFLRYCPG
jgi:DNA polymerase